MTVVGPIAGVVDGKVGSTPYKFMLMNATGYKRWNVVQRVVMPPQPIDPWMLGPRPWGYGYGGWGWYNPGPAEGEKRCNRMILLFMLVQRNSGRSAVSLFSVE